MYHLPNKKTGTEAEIAFAEEMWKPNIAETESKKKKENNSDLIKIRIYKDNCKIKDEVINLNDQWNYSPHKT